MFPSSSDEVDPTGATSSPVGSSDSPRTLQSYARLALAVVLAWIAAMTPPLLSDDSGVALCAFGHESFRLPSDGARVRNVFDKVIRVD
jgi:hypothetical protein